MVLKAHFRAALHVENHPISVVARGHDRFVQRALG